MVFGRILCYIALAAVTLQPFWCSEAFATIQFEGKKPSGKGKNASPMWVNKEEARLEEIAPKPVPDILFYDENNQPHHFEEFYGKLVLLNFWATWCTPCTHEMPGLSKLQKDFKRKNFRVVALSQDFKGADAVKEFYNTNEITNLPIYLDPKNTLFKAFGIVALPTSIVIDAEGNEIARILGYVDWDNEQIRQFLLAHTDHKTYDVPANAPAKQLRTEQDVPAQGTTILDKKLSKEGMIVPAIHSKDPKEAKVEKSIAEEEALSAKLKAMEKEQEAASLPESAVTTISDR